jgi:HK97 family phage major capsid protein
MTKTQMYDRMSLILATARSESRGLNAAERKEFDALEVEYLSADRPAVPETRLTGSGGRTPVTRYLRTGDVSGLSMRADGTGLSSAPNSAGLSAGSTGDFAGYMVPQGFWMNLEIALKAYGGVSNSYRRVQTDTGAPMPWPTTDPTGVTASVLGASNELTQLNVADSYTFGEGMLNVWTLYTPPLLASLQLVQDSAFSVDDFVSDRIGESIGRKMASLAVSGTGSGQPLGINTALAAKGAVGSGSGGYVQLGTATAVKTFAGSTTELAANVLAPATLIQMVSGVDAAYYPNAKWYMSAAQAWNFLSVVDDNGRPLLNLLNGYDITADGVTSPDYSSNSPVGRLLGFGVVIDNSISALQASTTNGPIFGDLSKSMVLRQVNSATVMRLNERYADFLAIGYIGFVRVDMRSNDLRAAIIVTASSS